MQPGRLPLGMIECQSQEPQDEPAYLVLLMQLMGLMGLMHPDLNWLLKTRCSCDAEEAVVA